MWEDGCERDHCGVHRGESKRCVAKENRPKETSQAVPWRKSEDDHKMDGERLKSDVVIMDMVHRERVNMEEHVRVPKRV